MDFSASFCYNGSGAGHAPVSEVRTVSLQTSYAMIYLEINLVAALLVLYIRIKTQGITQMVSQRHFSCAIEAEILFFFSDTAAVLISCGLLPWGTAGLLASKTLYFLSTGLMCFCWFIYFEHIKGSPMARRVYFTLQASCLIWVLALLLAVNLFTGILFYVDPDGVYRRGPLFILQYLLAYSYVFAISLHAIAGLPRTRNPAKRRRLLLLALFPVAPAGAGILQYIWPQLPVASPTMALTTLVLYQNWLDDMISVDPLTKLNNRKQLVYHYQQWRRQGSPAPLYLVLIDADRFKVINDTYGHIQGDAALKGIAEALRLACGELRGRSVIARYGGDEFSILVLTDTPGEVEQLCRRIQDHLARMSHSTPYHLSVSTGYARANRSLDLKDLIEAADVMLYQEKQEKRQALH